MFSAYWQVYRLWNRTPKIFENLLFFKLLCVLLCTICLFDSYNFNQESPLETNGQNNQMQAYIIPFLFLHPPSPHYVLAY